MAAYKDNKDALLAWMQSGNDIEQCSQPGYADGKLNGIESCPVTGNIHSLLHRLVREGKVEFETFINFGLRWEKFFSKGAKE